MADKNNTSKITKASSLPAEAIPPQQAPSKRGSKPASKKSAGVVISFCGCVSDYQDKRYGAGRRVHNVSSKGSRCTVCAKGGN